MKDEDAELEPWEDSEVFEVGLAAGRPPVGSCGICIYHIFNGNVMAICP